MENYSDKDIILGQKKWENETKSDINNKVYVNGEVFTFHDVEVIPGRMKIRLPEKFEEMPEKIKVIKYPMSDRPPIIKTNDLGDVDFSFNPIGVPCKPEQIPEIGRSIKQILCRVMPQYEMDQEYEGETKNGKYFAYDYSYNTLGSKVYAVSFGVCIDGQYVMCGFLCKDSDKHWWKDTVLQVISSIEDLTKKEEEK